MEELECRAQKQEATIAQQQNEFNVRIAAQRKQIETLTATVKKVSDQLELNKPAPQVVADDQ